MMLCIGTPLGRLEAQIALHSLLDHVWRLDLAGEPEWHPDRINTRNLERPLVSVGS